jgi:hypothetical protein
MQLKNKTKKKIQELGFNRKTTVRVGMLPKIAAS